MKLTQLQYYVAVYKYQNISKAAEELFVSQPTLSVSLKELEKEFNSKFFVRKNNLIYPTEKGTFFYEKAMRLLDEVQNFYEAMEEYQKENQRFRIGIPPMIGTVIFPTIFRQFQKEFPQIVVEIEEYGSIAIKKALKSGEVDLAIAILEENDDDFNSFVIYETELVFCVHQNHPLAKEDILDFSSIQNQPLILMKSDSYQNTLIKERFKKIHAEPNVKLYSTQLYTIKQFLLQDQLGAFLFREIAENNPELKAIPFLDPMKIKIALLWDKGDYLNRAAELFLKKVKRRDKDS